MSKSLFLLALQTVREPGSNKDSPSLVVLAKGHVGVVFELANQRQSRCGA